MEIKTPSYGEVYQHFKGEDCLYLVEGTAIDTITDNIVVIYKCQLCHKKYNEYQGQLFTRPLSDFFSDVSQRRDNTTGQKIKFELIGWDDI